MEPTNLRMLIELAIASRDSAAAQLAHTRQQVTQAQTQLSALHNYAREYSTRAQQQAQKGVDPATQSNWYAFENKLKQAIAEQGREIERRQALVLTAQNEFNEMQRRLKSLETLAARQLEVVRQKTARREQKQTDEMAARSVSALSAGLSPATVPATTSSSSSLHW